MKTKRNLLIATFGSMVIGALLLSLASAGEAGAGRVELGKITWKRDFGAAAKESRRSGRPMLVLFDEVPGCQTVRGYGADVLSHPLIVEAAETLFVPVLVLNNKGGADRKILRSFGEPAWNNPVVRIIDADRRPLAPRLDGDYTAQGLVAAMVRALRTAGREVPAYLRLLALDGSRHRQAVFAMHCFWVCEVHLGAIEGVSKTRAGFLDGREVVEVDFDPTVVSYERLVKAAKRGACATRVYARSDSQYGIARSIVGSAARRSRSAVRISRKDTKYQLRGTRWMKIPMIEAQASRVNAAVGRRQDPSTYLSRGQRRGRWRAGKFLRSIQ